MLCWSLIPLILSCRTGQVFPQSSCPFTANPHMKLVRNRPRAHPKHGWLILHCFPASNGHNSSGKGMAVLSCAAGQARGGQHWGAHSIPGRELRAPGLLRGCSCPLCGVWGCAEEVKKPPLPCWCCAWPRAGLVSRFLACPL